MGRTTSYTYDVLNRLTQINYKQRDPFTGTLPPTPLTSATYAYDELSRLVSAVNNAGTVAFTYDNRNRLKTETDVFGHVTERSYDAANRRTQLKLDGNVHTSYSYDNADRLNTLTDETSQNFTFAYDNANRLITKTMPNGVTSTYEYDGMSRLKRLKHQNSSATLYENQYVYNAANQISSITELTQTRNFTYDNLDRLLGMTNGSANENYAYDSVGNRTSSHLSSSYSYSPFNKLTATQTANYSFDANGNTVSKAEGKDFWRYTWDYENRLTEAASRKEKVRYKYDALGRRVSSNAGTKGQTKITYDGVDAILDNSDGTLTKYQNGLGIDNKLKLSTAAGSKYFLQDHLQSTLAFANSSGAVTDSNAYDSFGNASNIDFPSRFQYTGREFDNVSGLQYSRARFYDQKIGRFISEDPIGFRGGDINFYGYVWNNPTAFTDPMGLDGWGNDWADWADDKIDLARGWWKRDPQHWGWNGGVDTVGDLASGFGDMFRVGSGVGCAIYAEDENGYGRAAFIVMDITRGAGLFATMAGPFAGSFGPSNKPFLTDEYYAAKYNNKAPGQAAPYGTYERFSPNGDLKQVTTYDRFGDRVNQYDIGPGTRHGEGYHTFQYGPNNPRHSPGGGIRSPHILY